MQCESWRRAIRVVPCFRFIGVTRTKSGKWIPNARIEGQSGTAPVTLGVHSTEELAAQAYDKLCVYQARTPQAAFALVPCIIVTT